MPLFLRLSLIKVRLKNFLSRKEKRLDHLVSNEIKTGHKLGKLVVV